MFQSANLSQHRRVPAYLQLETAVRTLSETRGVSREDAVPLMEMVWERWALRASKRRHTHLWQYFSKRYSHSGSTPGEFQGEFQKTGRYVAYHGQQTMYSSCTTAAMTRSITNASIARAEVGKTFLQARSNPLEIKISQQSTRPHPQWSRTPQTQFE